MLNTDRTTKSVGAVLSTFMRKINCDARHIRQPVIEKLSVKVYREPAFLYAIFGRSFLTVVVSPESFPKMAGKKTSASGVQRMIFLRWV